ncbi:MAG TPA: M20/M25/M40 family metallo-hydrolase, partial [Bacillota bacterium]|nr:M20/M25/M40 family metallo-hydrolase [Bacillota bacterium]
GDVCALSPSLVKLMNNRYAAKAFDDRIGCAVAVKAASLVKTPRYDTYYVFTTQEEVGCRGSKTSAFSIAPDFGIALDVTSTGDTVGSSPMAVSLGNGTAIKIKDNSAICSPYIVKTLSDIAEKHSIKYQYEILEFGGTDASSMQTTGCGAHSGCISIPTRYVHSGVETIELSDCDASAKLLAAFIENVDGE